MNASRIEKDDLQPVLEIVFYESRNQSYVEYSEIKDLKPLSSKPLTYEGIEYILSKIKKDVKGDDIKSSFKDIIPSNVIYFDSNSISPDIVWFKKSHKNTFLFNDKKGFLNYPNLIFKIKNKNLYVYVVKTSNITGLISLFKAPFPNVYGDNKVCTGTVNLNSYLKGNYNQIMDNVEKVFFGSKFTLDLMSSDRTKTATIPLLKNLLDKDIPFPKQELVKIKNKLKDVLHE